MVLEKGLRLFGSSRSGRKDFEDTVRMYKEHPEILTYLECLVNNIVDVRNMQDIITAFEEDIRKDGGKTIMEWNI